MGCGEREERVQRVLSTNGGTRFAAYIAVEVGQFQSARLTLQVDGATSAFSGTTKVVYGNVEADLATGAVVDFPSSPLARSSDGVTYGSAFAALDTSYQYAWLGVSATNTSGSAQNAALVTLTAQLRTDS